MDFNGAVEDLPMEELAAMAAAMVARPLRALASVGEARTHPLLATRRHMAG